MKELELTPEKNALELRLWDHARSICHKVNDGVHLTAPERQFLRQHAYSLEDINNYCASILKKNDRQRIGFS